jgi:nanoRNase/pAp phosphatase (c-di-AMP/oligoRNAs hydrolase)
MDQNARQQIIDRLKEASNVLVTVSANPSVDQLAACIGFTLILNKLGKHGTAVFSGDVPSTIEFLKPDETLEKNTDSLRDFIIALDKSKADKLRYKVEDKVVKIFITPYRTSITDKDLDFSQGDFNVDAVVALGVHERTDLDQAITSHGRILHDATVISVNNKEQGDLGAINWVDLNASSLSEMLVELARGLTADPMDGQMATAFMTGIVAETDRFSNTKTSPRTMALASELMAAGANQQLIASKLQTNSPVTNSSAAPAKSQETAEQESEDGSLRISHQAEEVTDSLPKPVNDSGEDTSGDSDATEDATGLIGTADPSVNSPTISHSIIGKATDRREPVPSTGLSSSSRMTLEPPTMGGKLTANSEPEHLQLDPSTDPLSLPSLDSGSVNPPLLTRPASLSGQPIQPASSQPVQDKPADNNATLSSLEASVSSPHLNQSSTESEEPVAPAEPTQGEEIEDAREAVDEAIAAEPPSQPLDPIQALGAQPLGNDLGNSAPVTSSPPPLEPYAASPVTFPSSMPDPTAPQMSPVANAPTPDPFGPPPDSNGINPNNPSVPPSLLPPSHPMDTTGTVNNPTAPPPVPPPMMPPAQPL